MTGPALIVHGGAWDIPDDEVEAHVRGCTAAREAGWQVLMQGGTALEAAEAAVRVLEDDPTFDSGIGSVLNADGVVEMDAAIMDGQTLRSGGIAAVRRVAAPITLARRVLESHVILLVGEGAERFAQTAGVPLADPSLFVVEREQQRWERIRHQDYSKSESAFSGKTPGDTVGAVALDQYGNIAAATSTGGTPNKLPGRVGDSPLIGAGLYADNQTGGCSCTGWGEAIIKVLLAKTATDLIGPGQPPMDAAARAITVLEQRVGGYGGCILLDAQGRVGFAFNTPRMAYAYRTAQGDEAVGT